MPLCWESRLPLAAAAQERLARLEQRAKEERQKMLDQQRPPKEKAAAAAAAAAGPTRPSSMQEQVVAEGPVQGVIRRGKWSQKNQG